MAADNLRSLPVAKLHKLDLAVRECEEALCHLLMHVIGLLFPSSSIDHVALHDRWQVVPRSCTSLFRLL
jgi:hypothetical protein